MRTFTVKGLTTELDRLLSRHFPVVLVQGEISQLSIPASGHCYLQLRDGEAVLGGIVWRNTWQNLRYRPKRGDTALFRGRLGLYGAQGKYQLYINTISPVGAGAHAKKLEEIKARLDADGLLDPRRKRPLPQFPRVIGIATSLTGAALQDFLRVSAQRCPATKILVAGCTVQGREAASSVIRAVDMLISDGRSEVIVVTRGGGSAESLVAFMDEQLARFLAMSPIPVMSAVGHEVDTSITDLVADAVAPTPSAAAIHVLPDAMALAQRIDDNAATLDAAMRRAVENRRRQLEGLRARLRHPAERTMAMRRQNAQLEQRLHRAMQRAIEVKRARHQRASERLHALSPRNVLGRGYAIVTGPNGVVMSPADVSPGNLLEIEVGEGSFAASVTPASDQAPPQKT